MYQIIIGLGNPGVEYVKTRHNVGMQFLDYLSPGVIWQNEKLGSYRYCYVDLLPSVETGTILVKPQTFMNLSGNSLKFLKKKYLNLTGDKLLVVHDDLDLELGSWKLHFSKGPLGHNGLESLYQEWGSKEFWHLRIGIDNRETLSRELGRDYVLRNFSPQENEIKLSIFATIRNQLELSSR